MANINKNMLEIKAYTNTERETLNFFSYVIVIIIIILFFFGQAVLL